MLSYLNNSILFKILTSEYHSAVGKGTFQKMNEIEYNFKLLFSSKVKIHLK